MKYEICTPNEKDVVFMVEYAKNLFATDSDPTQAQPTIEGTYRDLEIEKHTILCAKHNGTILGWSVSVPTSYFLRDLFLNKKITESELNNRIKDEGVFETLYLMALIVLPEYQGQGIARDLLGHQIKYFSKTYSIKDYYAMIWSRGGESVVTKVAKDLSIDISLIYDDGWDTI